jgi:hypothetical protein
MLNGQVDQTFEQFLELPVAVVLAVLWLVGVVLESVCVLTPVLVGYWSVLVLW